MAFSSPIPMPLGMGAPQVPVPWAQRINAPIANNANMLMQLGLALMDKRQNNAVPFSAIGQQALAGREMDRQRQAETMTERWLMRERGLTREQAQEARANPVILAELMKPAKTYDFFSAGDTAYAGNQATGEATAIDGGQPRGIFSGKGLDAQALNQLVENGTLTVQQALEVAAGKAITGPNGETIWANPQAMAGAAGGVLGGQQGEQGAPGSGMTQLTGPRLTEDMRKAQGFAERAEDAEKIIADPKIAAAGGEVASRIAGGIPIFGNAMVTPEYRQFSQAQRNFINATLRRESGAVINEEEFENARQQYFPQPYDDAQTLRNKAENRKQAIENLRASAEPAPTFAEPPRVRKYNPQTGRIE